MRTASPMQFARSKTMIFSALLAALGAAQLALPGLAEALSPKVYGWATLAVAVLVAVLRAVTEEPLSEK